MSQDITVISKTVPTSEKMLGSFSELKLLKIVDHSLQGDVYAEKVDDIVVLKMVVCWFCHNETFIMKLLPNRRLVRFADVGSYSPYCICIRDDIIVIYIWSVTVKFNEYNNRNHVIWMNTEEIVTKRSLFLEIGWKRPCFHTKFRIRFVCLILSKL
ncbi:unnamed protein product [Mytilus edulis]|uniref:Uncharacterized protein n=1 Tax=Mytilus edulis TaxID=6550 RepID=A0A8S3UML2_MYTED|nr:unnamed protein product [Mytilus edulis]